MAAVSFEQGPPPTGAPTKLGLAAGAKHAVDDLVGRCLERLREGLADISDRVDDRVAGAGPGRGA